MLIKFLLHRASGIMLVTDKSQISNSWLFCFCQLKLDVRWCRRLDVDDPVSCRVFLHNLQTAFPFSLSRKWS